MVASHPDSLRPAEKKVRSGERQYPSMNSSRLPAFQAATCASSTARISAAGDFGLTGLLCFATCLGLASCATTFDPETQRHRENAGKIKRDAFFLFFSVFLCPCGEFGRRDKKLFFMSSPP